MPLKNKVNNLFSVVLSISPRYRYLNTQFEYYVQDNAKSTFWAYKKIIHDIGFLMAVSSLQTQIFVSHFQL